MEIVDRGEGVPIVMVPGMQGRWEWMAPAVDALARSCRVITFSLCDEPSSGFPLDPERGVENFLTQIESVLDHARLQEAVLIGVSYAGPLAAEFAVRHPHRVRALMLVSALPADWSPNRRARFYLRAPRALGPLFLFDAPLRAQPEIRAAFPRLAQRLRFSMQQTRTFFRCSFSPTRMARRINWLSEYRFSDPSAFRKPTMVVTGEPGLDRVVPPELTRRYLDAMPHAHYEVLARTGHLGLSTKPDEFAEMVQRFVMGIDADVRRASV
jgi:pimeloyl-ACP methyl ester carboxylesterase